MELAVRHRWLSRMCECEYEDWEEEPYGPLYETPDEYYEYLYDVKDRFNILQYDDEYYAKWGGAENYTGMFYSMKNKCIEHGDDLTILKNNNWECELLSLDILPCDIYKS